MQRFSEGNRVKTSNFRAQQTGFDFSDGTDIPVNEPIRPAVETDEQKRERIQARIRELEEKLRQEEARKAREAAEQRERARRAAEAEAERRRQERERQERSRRAWENFRRRASGYYAAGSADDPYAALGVPHGADAATVRAAWIKLVQQYHPDHGGNAEQFMKVQNAYERITGKVRR